MRGACWFCHDDDLEEVPPCRDVAASSTASDLVVRVRRLERIVEQIGSVLVPQIMKGDVDEFVGEHIGAVPVPQIWEPIGEVVQLSPQERAQNCTPEQIVDSLVSQLLEAHVDVLLKPQERVQNRTPEQTAVFPVPQIVEERVQNRTQEQISGSPVPQTMEAVMEVFPQERVQNLLPEQIMDFPVPQNMEDVEGVVRATPQERARFTGNVFTVRHHRGDQACAVDTVGLNIKGLVKFNMPRSGDVMVPALHMEVPSLHEAVTRFFEQHADEDGQLSWDTLYASLPPELARNLRRRAQELSALEEEDEEQGEILASS